MSIFISGFTDKAGDIFFISRHRLFVPRRFSFRLQFVRHFRRQFKSFFRSSDHIRLVHHLRAVLSKRSQRECPRQFLWSASRHCRKVSLLIVIKCDSHLSEYFKTSWKMVSYFKFRQFIDLWQIIQEQFSAILNKGVDKMKNSLILFVLGVRDY